MRRDEANRREGLRASMSKKGSGCVCVGKRGREGREGTTRWGELGRARVSRVDLVLLAQKESVTQIVDLV